MKQKKTNAMRMLDRQKIKYNVNTYEISDEHMDGTEVAHKVGIEDKYVYKTLVLENSHHQHFVFIIPVSDTLDMKAAANAVNEKKLHLMPLDELKNVTGYIRGGCSPIGMKKQFQTVVDQQATCIDSLYISGGERGVQIEMTVDDLIKITKAKVLNVTHQ
ncbi:Cys-tRNA(Pro) deacylase [Staphylococcus cohnii]|uniref:Cys-tRNA(Pro)/Cys-tRNA(Cys) deacylase n=2 Tax=Staphylococcus cohnii TaxID=29382 RepID=A0ABT6IZ18_9STAP|nr:Cys-tRNA(Pro) deacylase [Staphylococcus cohnii]TGP61654.1 Cys-tRNA(Pro) deacylase [bacterium M00.F.Ca.ET.229.01.1.1]TGS38224.1 Cys-tRNA(Pro) deacylase [bacterium M00.F.Ca.ET.180.01.1.1]AYX89122.1 Cys-tRNA(Pro) deacylase [Staphylococcus cohnii]KKI64965.1 Cys-tRNA(Pro) deacylase YbaK [Staphylococcus cohnii subsp. cohnii]MCI2940791.1 Cys-tRNA(Pro) deacylase [Staphylococcus cohnii]